MKIAIFGATGMIGERIVNEALTRGHEVTAVVRDPARVKQHHQNLQVLTGNILDTASVASAVAGHDAVVSAYGPGSGDPNQLIQAAHALIQGLQQAGVKRIAIVGGAGSLEVAPGVQLVDTAEFPQAWLGVALAHREVLNIFRKDGGRLDWTYISPAALIAPGERTGQFRIGGDTLLTDAAGQSRISAEDYAVAVLDELEKPAHIRQRITVAY
jgi:putative NADH-flavin reductase